MRTRLTNVCLVVVCLTASIGGPTARAASEPTPLLALRGRVTRAELERKNSQIVCRVDLELTFVNNGDEPVILVKPWHDGGGWFGGACVFATEADATAWKPLVRQYIGESSSTGEEYRELARQLDRPVPPEDVTVTIEPGGTWVRETTETIGFYERKGMHYPEDATWSEVVALGTQHWMCVSLELWPFNVESVRPNFGSELEKRWRCHGRLLLGERMDRQRHGGALTSEPIPLDLAAAEGFDGVRPVEADR